MKEGYDKKCYICKKKFCTYAAYEYWTYQRHAGKSRRFFCSYACMRKYDLRGKKEEPMYLEFKDDCANFIEDEDDYYCFKHGYTFRCDKCGDYINRKDAGDQEYERRRANGQLDTEKKDM